jgi:hypothetical protein
MKQRRRLLVMELYAKGASRAAIAETLGVSENAVHIDLVEVRKVWRAQYEMEAVEIRDVIMGRLDAVLLEAWAKGNLSVALGAVKEQAKILGLHAPKRIVVDAQVTGGAAPWDEIGGVQEDPVRKRLLELGVNVHGERERRSEGAEAVGSPSEAGSGGGAAEEPA